MFDFLNLFTIGFGLNLFSHVINDLIHIVKHPFLLVHSRVLTRPLHDML